MNPNEARDLVECPVCGSEMYAGMYICGACTRAARKEAPPLMARKPKYKPVSGCGRCPHEARCADRVISNLHVMCEIPDALDLLAEKGEWRL